MLAQVLHHIHNYFIKDTHCGEFKIQSGSINLPFVKVGQYFKIDGSDLNDGIYQYPISTLVDEEFDGVISVMSVPREVIDLSSRIGTWCEQNPNSAYTSESFGGYSYSRGSKATSGAPIGWQDVFRSELNTWRKLS